MKIRSHQLRRPAGGFSVACRPPSGWRAPRPAGRSNARQGGARRGARRPGQPKRSGLPGGTRRRLAERGRTGEPPEVRRPGGAPVRPHVPAVRPDARRACSGLRPRTTRRPQKGRREGAPLIAAAGRVRERAAGRRHRSDGRPPLPPAGRRQAGEVLRNPGGGDRAPREPAGICRVLQRTKASLLAGRGRSGDSARGVPRRDGHGGDREGQPSPDGGGRGRAGGAIFTRRGSARGPARPANRGRPAYPPAFRGPPLRVPRDTSISPAVPGVLRPFPRLPRARSARRSGSRPPASRPARPGKTAAGRRS